MKILHVISGVFKDSGGTSEVVPRLCEALVAAGHEVRILTLYWGSVSGAAERAMRAGVEIIQCKRDPVRFFKGLGRSKEFSRRIVEAVAWADAIHLHGLWQWPCWRAASEAVRQKKPYVMQTHGFLEPERLKKSRLRKIIIGRLVERPRLAQARRVIATAESEKASIISYGVKTPVAVVPIGMDTTEIDAAVRDDGLLDRLTNGMTQKGAHGRKKVLLYFSRIAPIKGLDLLAEAWAELEEFHADWQLVIAGPNDRGHEAVVKADFVAKVKDGSVSFPGPVYGKEKFTLLKSVDAFVLPTRSENFSIAVQEALAAGVPVVCTKGAPWSGIEGGAEWGRCGLWVNVNAQAIADGLRELLTLTETGRLRMGQEGQKFIQHAFDWTKIADKMLDVYQSSPTGSCNDQ